MLAFTNTALYNDRRLRRQIFWTGFLVRIAYILLAHTFKVRPGDDHFEFGWEMGRIGRALATGYGYADPFTGHTGPTAWTPPLYTLLIGGVFRLFGVYSRLSAFVLLGINSLFSAWTALLVYELGWRCFSRRVALWSGWLWALYPAAMQYAVRWIWEMSATAAVFTAILVLTLRMRGIGDQEPAEASWQQWAAFGLLWGVLALLNPAPLLMLPVTALYALTGHKRDRSGTVAQRALAGAKFQPGHTDPPEQKASAPECSLLQRWQHGLRAAMQPERLTHAALAGLLFLATVAPWTARNYAVFHRFIPVRDNFGAENLQGNNDSAFGFPLVARFALSTEAQRAEYIRMGEPAWSAERGARADAWIKAHPGRFLALTGKRAWMFWAGVPKSVEEAGVLEYLRLMSFQFLSLAGLFGAALALRRRVQGASLFAWSLILLPLPYYAVTVQARFRHVMEPVICVLGVFLFQSATRPRKRAALARRGPFVDRTTS